MANAKEELLEAVNGKAKIKCALITLESWISGVVVTEFVLKLNYTSYDFNEFIKSLDLKYDNGYGGQELFGTVWLEDGTWLSRGEYDGSEWWEHNVLPEIPSECL